jgi:hypothetical protein
MSTTVIGEAVNRELQYLLEVQSFYASLLEPVLDGPLPAPSELASDAASLKRWLKLLDLAVSPRMMRAALKLGVEPRTAASLLAYLVSKASTEEIDRDRADLVATSMYRTTSPTVDFSEERLELFQTELEKFLGPGAELPEEFTVLVREFDFFAHEIDDFRDFDQITDSDIVRRVREFKQRFGKWFYHPRVLAASAVYNAVFGARFDVLFEAAAAEIRSFAAAAQEKGGSMMTRISPDVTVKDLAGVDEAELLAEEYRRAQDEFRRISRMKKAVVTRRGVAPEAFKPNDAEETKLRTVRDSIQNFIRGAANQANYTVPLQNSNLALTAAEAELFRTDYRSEKSFRAEYACVVTQLLTLFARMSTEAHEYEDKRSSSYLWKPHADSLAYLMRAAAHAVENARKLLSTAQSRGLTDKVKLLAGAVEKVNAKVLESARLLQN